MTTGRVIANLRKEKGLSQVELAKILGIGKSTIAHYEVDKRQVPNILLVKLADFFDVTTDCLLCREDEFGIKIKKP